MKLNQNLLWIGVSILFILLTTIPYTSYSNTDEYAGFRFEEGKHSSSFKFSIENGLIILPVTVEGKRLNFIFDSGMNSIIIFDKRDIKNWKTRQKNKVTFSGLGGNKIVRGIRFDGLSVNMPNIRGKGLSLVATTYTTLPNNFENIKINGVFGYQLLSKFIVQIDYKNNIITLIQPEYFVSPLDASQLDLTIVNTKPYIKCPVIIDEKKFNLNLLVDTGAGTPMIVNANSIPGTNLNGSAKMVGIGLAGPIIVKNVTINDIVLGTYHLPKDFEAWVPVNNSFPNESKKIIRDGTLGVETLSQFIVTFDYFNNKIYLQNYI